MRMHRCLIMILLLMAATLPAHFAFSDDVPGNASPVLQPETLREGQAPAIGDDEQLRALLKPARELPGREVHIALILPLKSAQFRHAAESLRQGVAAAYEWSPNATKLPLKIYPVDDEKDAMLAAYEEALSMGARACIAGMTRDGATQLAAHARAVFPVLALNQPERETNLPEKFFSMSLSLDEEARQVARVAYSEGRRRAVVIASAQPLAKRVQAAFEQEWKRLHGELLEPAMYAAEQNALIKMKTTLLNAAPDMAFITGDVVMARNTRPFIPASLPAYGTSQIYPGRAERHAKIELQAVRFIDMPWMLEPDHPAVMVYPRPPATVGTEAERLYALGIDAYRVAELLRSGEKNLRLDGVTGNISLFNHHFFVRELTTAHFHNGEALAVAKTAAAR
jgi:uncharacterized protein